MAHYILQILFFQLSFLLVYELLLKKETFFNYNRCYLLLTPIISFLLPFLEFQSLNHLVPAQTVMMLPEVFIGGKTETAVTLTTSSGGTGFHINWWLVLYCTGFLISFGFLINKFFILKRLFRGKIISKEKDYKIIEVPGSGVACTFLNNIFFSKDISETEKQQILEHELVHVRQKHSVDLLFFELLKLIFWFNPLMYLYQQKIAGMHEFIADAAVVKNIQKRDYYEQLLNSAFNTNNISFINQFFNHSLIKKRIVMLQKSKSKTIAKFKYLLLVPLLLAMLTYVACSQDKMEQRENAPKMVADGEIIKLHVQDVNNLSEQEEAKRNSVINMLGTEGNPSTLIITDGKSSARIFVDDNPGTLPPPPPPPHSYSEEGADVTITQTVKGDVPFSVIDEVPVYPGCEELTSNEARKTCMTEKIAEFVNQNFNTGLGKELGLKGINRINVQFKITTSGAVEIVGVRGPNVELEEEARRVINALPQMTPGKQDGKEVGVLYALPITFKVGE